jgi:hypothetical protein
MFNVSFIHTKVDVTEKVEKISTLALIWTWPYSWRVSLAVCDWRGWKLFPIILKKWRVSCNACRVKNRYLTEHGSFCYVAVTSRCRTVASYPAARSRSSRGQEPAACSLQLRLRRVNTRVGDGSIEAALQLHPLRRVSSRPFTPPASPLSPTSIAV